MKRTLLALAGLALAAPAAGQTGFQTGTPSLAADAGARYVDTDWVCTDRTRKRLEIRHNLGTAPRFFTLYFAPDQNSPRIYPVQWSWTADSSGNPVTIEVTSDSLFLNIFEGAPVHGVWDGSTGQWQSFDRGCFRAFMIQ